METTLYDKSGRPIAYISSDNDDAIYLWDGHAVCYVYDSKIYGWRGKHIGWFIDGIIYDNSGYRVGYIRKKCPSATYATPAKYAKYARYAKYAKYAAYARPALSTGQSDLGLKEFLEQDRV
ncbi:MAG: hypothetical protein GX311_07385 [Bacteroidales bacterium]|jgi:hypothetical protein|nr:hypothetical protein [Bacteroidales bacterium]